MKKKIREQVSGIIWMIIGGAFFLGSLKLGVGTFSQPSSGLLSFLSGGVLFFLGLLQLLNASMRGGFLNERGEHVSTAFFGKTGLYVVFGLFAYVCVLQFIGFLISTLLLLYYLFRVMAQSKWYVPILHAFVAVTLSYLIFQVWLKIMFPSGILSFG